MEKRKWIKWNDTSNGQIAFGMYKKNKSWKMEFYQDSCFMIGSDFMWSWKGRTVEFWVEFIFWSFNLEVNY